jgi:maltose O-acetyltransferase
MMRWAVGRLERWSRRLASVARVLYYKAQGIDMPLGTKIASGSAISGNVTLGAGVVLDAGTRIRGQVSIGAGCRIAREVEIVGNVEIGCHTVIGSYSIISTMPAGRLRIGDDVLVNSYNVLGASQSVEIGDHCIFAAYVQITDASHGFDDPDALIKHAEFATAPVRLEQNVWLGSGVMVTKGVTIGAGAVVGAKSLVTKDIPALGVAYGLPAKVVRIRGKSQESP